MIISKSITAISLLFFIFLTSSCDQILAVCAPDYITIQNTCLSSDVRCGTNAVYFNGACNAVNVVPGICATNEVSLNNCCCPASCVVTCVQRNICSCCPAALSGGSSGYGCGYYQPPTSFNPGVPSMMPPTVGQPPCQPYNPSSTLQPNPFPAVTTYPSNPSYNYVPPCANATSPLPPYYTPYPPLTVPSEPVPMPPSFQTTPTPGATPPIQVVPTPQPHPSISTALPPPTATNPPEQQPPLPIPAVPVFPTYPTPPSIVPPLPPIIPSKPDTPPTSHLSCPNGTILMDGKCQLIYCPPGSTMHNDRCVHFECPPGLEWNGLQCIAVQPTEHHLTFNHSITNYFNDTRSDITLNMVNNLHVNASLQIDVGKFPSHEHPKYDRDDNDFSDEKNTNVWESGEEHNPIDNSNESDGDGNGKDNEDNSDEDDNDFDGEAYNNATEDSSKRRCCIVISPRICRPTLGTQRWSCHSRRQKLCGTICTASKIVIRAPRIQYHQTGLVMPPMFYNECRYQRTSTNCSPGYRGEYYDCSGCLTMLDGRFDSCSPYCYRYNCISSLHRRGCNYYDQQMFCSQYRGHFGCQEMDGCFDDWC